VGGSFYDGMSSEVLWGVATLSFLFEKRLSQDRKVGLGGFGGVEFFFFSPSMTIPFVPSHSNVKVPQKKVSNGHTNPAKFPTLHWIESQISRFNFTSTHQNN